MSAVLADGSIVEMVHQAEPAQTLFVVGRDGEWRYEKSVMADGVRLVPYSPRNNLLEHGVVLYPSEPTPYDSEASLVAEVRAFIHRYVEVSPLFEKVASYYVLLAWVYDAFNELPYLRLRGEPGSGKTRFLLTVGSLCYKPIFASGASTVSPLFRILDAARGTLIIDEGDFRFSDEKAELVKILNNGNAKGFPVLRSEVTPQKEFDPRAFAVFGPKLVATRGLFQDRALESRCLTEEMGEGHPRSDIPITLPPTHKAEALTLRNKLLTFRLRNLHRRMALEERMDRHIEPRLAQVFLPLLSIIDDKTARQEVLDLAQRYQADLLNDRGMDAEAQVLEIIRDLLSQGRRLAVKDITTWFVDRFGADHDQRITPRWIGNLLRNRLYLHTQKSHGTFIIVPNDLPKLKRLFERYGVEEAESSSSASMVG